MCLGIETSDRMGKYPVRQLHSNRKPVWLTLRDCCAKPDVESPSTVACFMVI